MPIYLPPLDNVNSKIVGGDQDVVLTMAGVPGVEFTVFARSVTFPDGSKIGRLSLSQVHADKVPMPPPNGTAPRVVWTLQPAGVKFDPPIRVQLPNTENLKPGQVIEIVQFDHDLEQFVSVGTARATENGLFLVTDAGFGITKSGWGGPECRAAGVCLISVSIAKAPPCKKPGLFGIGFVPDESQDGVRCDDAPRNFQLHGVRVSIHESCRGICSAGECRRTPTGLKASDARNAANDALDRVFLSSCITGSDLRNTMRSNLRSNGLVISCVVPPPTFTHCWFAPSIGGNLIILTTDAFIDQAACGPLASGMLHEMVHAHGNNTGVPGHNSLRPTDPNLPNLDDAPYGCQASCFGFANANPLACR
ncbi:MAG: hypothetical protein ACREUU_00095, partial [Gammaproteobacteria bacterium]